MTLTYHAMSSRRHRYKRTSLSKLDECCSDHMKLDVDASDRRPRRSRPGPSVSVCIQNTARAQRQQCYLKYQKKQDMYEDDYRRPYREGRPLPASGYNLPRRGNIFIQPPRYFNFKGQNTTLSWKLPRFFIHLGQAKIPKDNGVRGSHHGRRRDRLNQGRVEKRE
jgi:hypothetical protein